MFKLANKKIKKQRKLISHENSDLSKPCLQANSRRCSLQQLQEKIENKDFSFKKGGPLSFLIASVLETSTLSDRKQL